MTLNNNNVKTVLPATGSGSPANTVDQKSYKQELKNRIITLKAQQKELTKNLSAAQKELTKVSAVKVNKAPKTVFKKKSLQIVKKKNSKNK